MTEDVATLARTETETARQNGARAFSAEVAPPADRWTVLWQAKLWIVLAAVIVGMGTFLVSRRMAPVYSSSIVVQVAAPSPAGVSPNEVVLASNNLAAEYAQLSATYAVLDPAASQLHIGTGALKASVTASVLANQNLIQIAAQSSSRSGAVAAAGGVARSLQSYVNNASVSSVSSDVALRRQSLDAQILSLTTQIQAAQGDADAAVHAASGTSTGSAAQTVVSQREAYVTQLGLQRSTLEAQRQGLVTSTLSNGSINSVGAASGASQVQPKPMLYAAVALIVSALVAAQLAVFIGSRRQRGAARSRERQ